MQLKLLQPVKMKNIYLISIVCLTVAIWRLSIITNKQQEAIENLMNVAAPVYQSRFCLFYGNYDPGKRDHVFSKPDEKALARAFAHLQALRLKYNSHGSDL